MTYNILDGGVGREAAISEVIHEAALAEFNLLN